MVVAWPCYSYLQSYYTAQLSPSQSSDESNSSRKGVIYFTLTAITLVIPVSITCCAKPLIHAIQQHPHRPSIAIATIMAVNIEVSNPLHFPNHFSIIVVSGFSIPEFSAHSLDNDYSPSSALVILSSGAVLFGIKLQQVEPMILHTPPFSAKSISNAILFCTFISKVLSNWS